jgi:hypothetical protein
MTEAGARKKLGSFAFQKSGIDFGRKVRTSEELGSNTGGMAEPNGINWDLL